MVRITMNLKHNFWYFESALTPKFCDDVIKYGLSEKENMARTGGYDKNKKLSKKQINNMQKKRKSDVVWLSEEWIYKEIQPYVHIANKNAGWNFEWNRSEACQFTKYKLNQYYDWHCDSWHSPYNKPGKPDHGMVRKLSVTCQLTDGLEYKGGDLEFDFRNYDPPLRNEKYHVIKTPKTLSKGSVVVFPSFLWHRVKPVTEGTRYSLVVWNIGYPFK
tara:strand:+ start:1398 stop:2048 length:651 start_codon:yes stop_codon:yes gene_type:complete